MVYVDTSVLVAALAPEAATPRIVAWLGAQPAGTLAISDWTLTEVSSALSLKHRTGQLSEADRKRALRLFEQMVADSFIVLAISRLDFRVAAEMVARPDTGLRAGDALHLAVAVSAGLPVYTLDKRLAEAGPQFGLVTAFP